MRERSRGCPLGGFLHVFSLGRMISEKCIAVFPQRSCADKNFGRDSSLRALRKSTANCFTRNTPHGRRSLR
jgi:hypothetical protein